MMVDICVPGVEKVVSEMHGAEQVEQGPDGEIITSVRPGRLDEMGQYAVDTVRAPKSAC
jgi:hypothetical protein